MSKYTKEILEPLVKESTSIAQVIQKLGLKPAGGTHSHISKKLKQFEIDTTHFLGQASNSGKNHVGGPTKKDWKSVLIKKKAGNRTKTFQLRRALQESGREYICEECGQHPEWHGKPLVLQIDHINGDWLDSRPENVRFMCGHCHSQTPNWCKPVR